ncbi:MAG: hypothetical protein K2G16_03620 [Lachnospiraceae bacterium]|nr:hypothetical protein [Lachnospiraceae bacterium]
MKKAVMLCDKKNRVILAETMSIMKEIWRDMGYEVMELFISEEESPDKYMNKLVELKEDFLVTFAMAGFAWRGLMEQVRFNTLMAMQIHILIGELPQYDFFLQKEYGIHSFFFTDNEKIAKDWKERYSLVPFLKGIPTLYVSERLTEEEKRLNRENLKGVLQTVTAFIEKPSVL